jgi:ABC-2 type transport system ATP-binding protein
MLEVKDLKKHFGAIYAVRGISFKVEEGEILGFLGPNGAGKSTTMRMLTGFIPPDGGTATICGHDVVAAPVAAKQCLGYLPENAPVYADMTVTNFLHFIASIRGFRGSELKDRVESVVKKCYLEKVRHQVVDTLSKGYKQRVCFAQAVLHDPPVLVMDEPTDGLDPNQKHIVRTMIKEMARKKAIVISTHILEEVGAVCSRAIIITDGKVVANGTPDELKAKSPSGRLEDVFRELTIGSEEVRKKAH